jgi:hypothetical protein
MQLSASVLARVRGSVVVVAMIGCSAPTPDAPPAIEPAPAPVLVAAAPDPVPYDGREETARLSRIDARDTLSASDRDARIDRAEHAHARARIPFPPGWTAQIACGRG